MSLSVEQWVCLLQKNHITYDENCSFGNLTTFGVGGKIKLTVYPDSVRKLVVLVRELSRQKEKYVIVGNGSNILASDEFFDGVVIVTKRLNAVVVDGNKVVAQCGANTAKLFGLLKKRGLSGGEFLGCIPSTIGAAVRGNAGCFGQETSFVVDSVLALCGGKVCRFSRKQCRFAKRSSVFKQNNWLVLSVTMRFTCSSSEKVANAFACMIGKKASTQPLGQRSAGSMLFHRQIALSRYLDRLYTKGLSCGGAVVSKKHAGFVINIDKATSKDIYYILLYQQKRLLEHYGVVAQREITLVGFDELPPSTLTDVLREEQMTFSQTVKSEVLKNIRKLKGCCATSFLTAVVKSIGSLELSFDGIYFSIESDNYDLLTFCKQLAYEQVGVNSTIQSSNPNAKGAAVYSCEFNKSIGGKLGLTYRDDEGVIHLNDNVQTLLPQNECCKRAFMQGLMLAAGSVVIPVADSDVGENTSGARYHAELRFSDADFATAVQQLYADIPFRLTTRKNTTILYLKDSEIIADFLVYLNAMSAKLKLENIIIGRSLRNTANRQRNCIAANIDKSINASERQLEAIAHIRKCGMFDMLSPQLQQVVVVREQNPEATLDEIAAKLGVSKSGANHRLSKLIDIANNKDTHRKKD